MSDIADRSFVRQELIPERAAPVKTTGVIGFVRTRLFNSPTNVLLTIASALLLWYTIVPTLKFTLVDAVWHGSDRPASRAGRMIELPGDLDQQALLECECRQRRSVDLRIEHEPEEFLVLGVDPGQRQPTVLDTTP